MQLSPILFKQTCVIPLGTNSTGKFTMGINMNGAPSASTINRNIVIYTQDSALTPVTYQDFSVFNPALGVGLKGIWSQMRMCAVKLRFIPYHSQDESTIMVPGNLFTVWDMDGHEKALSLFNNEDVYSNSFKVLSMIRPWKIYRRSLKYRLRSKIPATSPNVVANNNQNLAGLWHGVGDCIGTSDNTFGCHLIIHTSNATNSFTFGNIVITGYFQLKDRI